MLKHTKIRFYMLLASCLFVSSFLVSCSATLEDYENTQPEFDLRTFFNGELVAYGIFQDRSNQVVRRFRVEMTGTWTDDQGVLDETFYYADGTTEKRIWTLTYLGNNQYQGTASDVEGIAEGAVKGFALNWSYTLSLPVDGDKVSVEFDDWMYLVDNNNLINRAKVTKFGFDVGEVTLLIQKVVD
jgi:hypothetical protein